MTLEYVLLFVAIFGISLKFMVEAPKTAFQDSGPRLGARVEKHLSTGTGFTADGRAFYSWEPEQP